MTFERKTGLVLTSEAHEEDVFTLEERVNAGLVVCVLACVFFWAAFALGLLYFLG